jgi:hypothetical protein
MLINAGEPISGIWEKKIKIKINPLPPNWDERQWRPARKTFVSHVGKGEA